MAALTSESQELPGPPAVAERMAALAPLQGVPPPPAEEEGRIVSFSPLPPGTMEGGRDWSEVNLSVRAPLF